MSEGVRLIAALCIALSLVVIAWLLVSIWLDFFSSSYLLGAVIPRRGRGHGVADFLGFRYGRGCVFAHVLDIGLVGFLLCLCLVAYPGVPIYIVHRWWRYFSACDSLI